MVAARVLLFLMLKRRAMPGKNLLIDFGMLEKLAEQGAVGLARPIGLPANALGFTALDVADIDPLLDAAIAAGKTVEIERGGVGFSPNTITTVWPDNQLSIDGLMTVARNSQIWNHQNR